MRRGNVETELHESRAPLLLGFFFAAYRNQKAYPARPPPYLIRSVGNAPLIILLRVLSVLALDVEIVRKVVVRIIVGAMLIEHRPKYFGGLVISAGLRKRSSEGIELVGKNRPAA